MPRFQVTTEEIIQTTRAVIDVLKKLDLECCLIGSAACYAYGTSTRIPNDVDMVVLNSPWPQEELKRRVVAADSRFYTIASKDPFATYRVLFFRLTTSFYYHRSCKVDLLIPGVMNIPRVPSNRVSFSAITHDDIHSNNNASWSWPLMPFIPLLMLKLQGWTDHKNSPKSHMRPKQYVDISDVLKLLELARGRYSDQTLSKDESWLPESFVTAARDRVKLFIEEYPGSKEDWAAVGF
ncbi:hypothetical protein VNI00_010487 [Paramarasmius palmivorus]|uniref:Polymerase nucleotidyl transferase domain-containing protein n=1 Tax=Paramarasmius palmivorus TaxID=297713 RepID=A0AAW0CIV6_9AGAR